MTGHASPIKTQIAPMPRPHRINGGWLPPTARTPAQTAPTVRPIPCGHPRSSSVSVMSPLGFMRDDPTRAHPPLTRASIPSAVGPHPVERTWASAEVEAAVREFAPRTSSVGPAANRSCAGTFRDSQGVDALMTTETLGHSTTRRRSTPTRTRHEHDAQDRRRSDGRRTWRRPERRRLVIGHLDDVAAEADLQPVSRIRLPGGGRGAVGRPLWRSRLS